MVICKPGSIEPALKVRASIYILTKDEGGTGKPLKHMGQEMIFSRTFDCMAATNYDNPDQRIMPGENGEMNLVFRTPMVSLLMKSFLKMAFVGHQKGRQIHHSQWQDDNWHWRHH